MHANLLHFVMSTMLIFDNYLYCTEILFFKKKVKEKTSVLYGTDWALEITFQPCYVLGGSIFLWFYIRFHVHLLI